jgi:hypothetical protein
MREFPDVQTKKPLTLDGGEVRCVFIYVFVLRGSGGEMYILYINKIYD